MKNLRIEALREEIDELRMDIQYHRAMIDSSMSPTINEYNEHKAEIEHIYIQIKILEKRLHQN